MKQTTKRFYGTLVGVAFLSGLTGAFAYSLSQKSVDKVLPSFSFTEPKKAQEPVGNLMTLSTASAPAVQPVDLTEAAEKACNAVVYIKVVQKGRQQTIEYRDPFEDFFGDFFGRGGGGTQRRQVETPKREAAGSGVIISDDGYIVTNNHVVEDADEITITLNDNREFKARVIGLDADSDLALLKIDASGLPAIVIGDSEQLKVGEWVLAVGNPFNLTSTVTAGIVSAKARNIGAHKNGIESFIQTDAAINLGCSGGAILNSRGEVIGITSAKAVADYAESMGYGIPVDTAIPVLQELINRQTRSTVDNHGYLGITVVPVSEEAMQLYNMPAGAFVYEVGEGSGAEAAGIKKGDIITKFDGVEIDSSDTLVRTLGYYEAGETVTVELQVSEGGAYVTKEVEVTLQEGTEEQKEAARKEKEEKEKEEKEEKEEPDDSDQEDPGQYDPWSGDQDAPEYDGSNGYEDWYGGNDGFSYGPFGGFGDFFFGNGR